MTRGRKKTTPFEGVSRVLLCPRSCSACKYVICEHVYGNIRKDVPVACMFDHDVHSAVECFDCERTQRRRTCQSCGASSVDYDFDNGVVTCRGCLCGDYKPSYRPESASSLYGMQQWAPGNDIGTAALDRALDRAIVRMGIPTEDFTTEGVK